MGYIRSGDYHSFMYIPSVIVVLFNTGSLAEFLFYTVSSC